MAIAHPTSSQPAVIIVVASTTATASTKTRSKAITDHHVFLPGIAGKVLVQTAMTRYPACDEELLVWRQISNPS
jgi:hypothetical protein